MFFRVYAAYKRHTAEKEIEGSNLYRVGFRARHGDLRASMRVDHIVAFAGDRGTFYIYNRDHGGAAFSREAQRRQGIDRLAGLGDHDRERGVIDQRLLIAELGGDGHCDRDPETWLDQGSCDHPGVHGSSAGDDADICDPF